MTLNEIVSMLNNLSVCALKNMGSKPYNLKLWIEDGEITGFINEGEGKKRLNKVEKESTV